MGMERGKRGMALGMGMGVSPAGRMIGKWKWRMRLVRGV